MENDTSIIKIVFCVFLCRIVLEIYISLNFPYLVWHEIELFFVKRTLSYISKLNKGTQKIIFQLIFRSLPNIKKKIAVINIHIHNT